MLSAFSGYQVHSSHHPEGAAAGPAGVQRPAVAGVGPRGPQAKGDWGQLGGPAGLRPRREKAWPLVQAQRPPLWSTTVLARTGHAGSGTDPPCLSLSSGAEAGVRIPHPGNPQPGRFSITFCGSPGGEHVRQPHERQQCGGGAGRGGAPRQGPWRGLGEPCVLERSSGSLPAGRVRRCACAHMCMHTLVHMRCVCVTVPALTVLKPTLPAAPRGGVCFPGGFCAL